MKLRFRYYPDDESRLWWKCLLGKVFEDSFEIVEDPLQRVDVSITGPYYPGTDHFVTPRTIRALRGAMAKSTKGRHVSARRLSTGVTIDRYAIKNIWFSGENERPPFGSWNCFLGFDYLLRSQNYFYLPLWQITSMNLGFGLPKESYWKGPILTSEELIEKRHLQEMRSKFACAFVGKAYSGRLHILERLNSIDKVDVYGLAARREVLNASDIASQYKFCVVIENDFYPGYVTEKPLEAYLSGTVPIYAGIDTSQSLNKKAILNLLDFDSIYEWLETIARVNTREDEYKNMFEQPILDTTPKLEDLVEFLRQNLLFRRRKK